MKFICFFCALSVFVFSCGQKSTVVHDEEITDSSFATIDSTEISNDTIAKKFFPKGSRHVAFQGSFPCNNCDEIVQTIMFNSDHTFQQQHEENEGSDDYQKSYGNWSIKNDKIQLTAENKPPIVLRIVNDTLYAINIHNIPVVDTGAYKLIKQPLASASGGLDKIRNKGVDFFARGNEPFWTVEIDKGKSMKFQLADWETPVVAPLESFSETVDSTVYNLHTNKKNWSVTIYPHFCSDGMSPLLYQYKVKVFYNGIVYNGCGIKLN
jgi:uncharacterized membrane protein